MIQILMIWMDVPQAVKLSLATNALGLLHARPFVEMVFEQVQNIVMTGIRFLMTGVQIVS